MAFERSYPPAQEDVRKIARKEIDAHHARESAGMVPYRSDVLHVNRRPSATLLTKDPEYLAGGAGTGGDDDDEGGPVCGEELQLKDFQLTGLNWLLYCWSRGKNGILADEVCTFKLHGGYRV